MIGLKKKGPSRPTEAFAHAEGCKVVVADPGFQPEWQEIEEGHWRRTCQCYSEDIYEPRVDTRARLDPLNPATFRHAGECEHPATTDPAVIRAILKVTQGPTGDYPWVQCSACDHGWQVPYYAAESAG
jgi:hypothetical protein